MPARMFDALNLAYEMAENVSGDPSWLPGAIRGAIKSELAYSVPVSLIETWLAQPERYSPYPDLVALDRAWFFDWSAIANLSDLEWDIFVGDLARSGDPLGFFAHNPRRYDAFNSGSEYMHNKIKGAVEGYARRVAQPQRRALARAT